MNLFIIWQWKFIERIIIESNQDSGGTIQSVVRQVSGSGASGTNTFGSKTAGDSTAGNDTIRVQFTSTSDSSTDATMEYQIEILV